MNTPFAPRRSSSLLVFATLLAGGLSQGACGDGGETAPVTNCAPACGQDQVCDSGQCVPKDPVVTGCDPACGAQETCVEHQCVPAAPVTDVCVPACGAGLQCVGGACVVPGGTNTCAPACEAGYTCDNSVCVHAGGNSGHETAAGASWAILVYLVGDNNLEAAAVADLGEMLDIGGGASFKFVVQVDRAIGESAARVPGVGDWTSAKRLVLQGGAFEVVADLGEVNMADPAVLADFIAWGVHTYPADRRMIVFWDHGAGWVGFGQDEGLSSGPMLTLRQLKQGISQGLQAADLARFDVIGFDACLMANYETASVLRPFAEYFIASEESEPGHGWDYRAFAAARDNPAIGTVSLLSALVDGYFAQAAASSEKPLDLTLSVLDLTRLGDLATTVNALGGALSAALPAQAAAIGKARSTTTRFAKAARPEQEFHLVDLGDLASQVVGTAPGLADAQEVALHAALDEVVLINRTGPMSDRATGLTVYFPPSSDLYDATYDSLTEVAAWRNFLRLFYQSGSLLTNPIDLPDAPAATVVRWLNGLATIDVSVPAATAQQLTAADAYYGVVSETSDDVYLLYMEPAWWSSASTLQGAWDGSALVVSQGAVEAYGYAEFSADAGAQFIKVSVPFAYQTTGASESRYVELRVTFSATTGDIHGSAYYEYSDAGLAELTPAPGSLITPIIPVLTSTDMEWSTTAPSPFDATQPVSIAITDIFAELGPGSLIYLDITVDDYAGNSDYVSGLLPWVAQCGTVDEVGQCQGDELFYCENDELQYIDCGAEGWSCEFVNDEGGYFGCVDNAPPDPCQGVTEVGVCQDNVLYYCDAATLYYVTCADYGKTCAFDAANGWYDCL